MFQTCATRQRKYSSKLVANRSKNTRALRNSLLTEVQMFSFLWYFDSREKFDTPQKDLCS